MVRLGISLRRDGDLNGTPEVKMIYMKFFGKPNNRVLKEILYGRRQSYGLQVASTALSAHNWCFIRDWNRHLQMSVHCLIKRWRVGALISNNAPLGSDLFCYYGTVSFSLMFIIRWHIPGERIVLIPNYQRCFLLVITVSKGAALCD
jgi:hypothetical protein